MINYKKYIITLVIFSFMLLMGCNKIIEVPIGTKPTKYFIVDDYFSSNMVLQCDEEISIYGTAEKGVSIVVSLYRKDKLIEQEYTITDNSGNWILNLKEQKGSFEKYTIEVKDLYSREKKFENIVFGDVFLCAGDEIKLPYDSLKNSETYDEDHDDQIYIYDFDSWKTILNDKINYDNNSLIVNLYNNVKKYVDYPLAFIPILSENTVIDQWVSSEMIKSNLLIDQYIEENGRNLESDTKLGVSYYYENYISKLENINIKMMFFNPGKSEIELPYYYKKPVKRDYYLFVLMSFYDMIYKRFNEDIEIVIFGNDSICESDKITLRQELTNSAFTRSFVRYMPMYDLNINILENQIITTNEINVNLFNNRFDIMIGNPYYKSGTLVTAPVANNFIYDDEQIIIKFSEEIYTDKLDEENTLINGLIINDKFDNNLDIEIKILDNTIILDVSNIEDYKGMYISYAVNSLSSKNNLTNYKGIPVCPFEIQIL